VAGPGLRAAGAARLTGIEMEPGAAELALAVYDDVHVGTVEEVPPALAGTRRARLAPGTPQSRALDRITRGRSTEFLVAQWYVARGGLRGAQR
jgi:hypothetical protein